MKHKKLLIRVGLTALVLAQGTLYLANDSSASNSAVVAEVKPPELVQKAPADQATQALSAKLQGLSQQLVSAHEKDQPVTEIVEDFEEFMLSLLEDQGLPLEAKIALYEEIEDVDIRDRVLPDFVSALTRELSIDDALAVGGKLGITTSSEDLEEFVAARFESHPKESLQWLISSEDKDVKNELLPELVSQWAAQDTAGAAAFLEDLPNSEQTKDVAIGLFVHTVLRSDPTQANHFIAKIQDEDYREYLQEEARLVHSR